MKPLKMLFLPFQAFHTSQYGSVDSGGSKWLMAVGVPPTFGLGSSGGGFDVSVCLSEEAFLARLFCLSTGSPCKGMNEYCHSLYIYMPA